MSEQEPTTPAAAAARALIDRRTPPTVTIRHIIVSPDGPTGQVLERTGPMGNVGPWKQVAPPRPEYADDGWPEGTERG